MDVLDALSRQDAVRHVTTRHEQGAAFMADVHGRLTGRAAVAMATLGPGATNLVTGIADAFLDRAPMVAITGQAASTSSTRKSHQFVDIVRMIEPVTKWNQRVERAGAIPEIVRKAFRVAELEKPGPTHIELPENLAATPVDDDVRPLDPTQAYFPEPTDEAIAHAARLLAASSQAARPRRQRRPPAQRLGRAARLRQGPPRPGRGDVHGQGRHRRPQPPVADGGRAPGPRPRPVRVRPGGPRDRRRLRPRRVRAGPLEPRRPQADHPHRHPAGRGRRLLPARGRADRRHRGLAPAPARRGPAPRHRRPRRASERHAARETLVHQDLRTALLAELRAFDHDEGWPIKPQKAIADLRRALGPEDIVGQRRRRPQDLGRPAVPGLRAEHGHHLERLRGDGHLAARARSPPSSSTPTGGSSRCAATAAS